MTRTARRSVRRSLKPDRSALAALPAVEKLLAHPLVVAAASGVPRPLALAAVRSAVEAMRIDVRAGRPAPASEQATRFAAEAVRAAGHPSLRRVLNATGTIVHTNLGRAPLAESAVAQVAAAARGYSNLELDLATGERGSRHAHVEPLLAMLTGGEAAMVVNNNAAAVVLALNTLSPGRTVLVSRGELVEIGGGFRIPEIIEKSGCRLREVGTTNRTRLADFVGALAKKLDPPAGALLKVHTSNFRVVGFTEEASLEELVALGRKRKLPVVHDLGSGLLLDLARRGIGDEPVVRASLRTGADVVSFSGDKLLGGPQAGILVGRRRAIDAMKRNPMTRMLRPDKLTLAALEATLRLFLDPERAAREVPVLAMLLEPADSVRGRAERLASAMGASAAGETVAVVPTKAAVGGGALPGVELPSFAVSLRSTAVRPAEIAAQLRQANPPVLGRVERDRVLLDCRALAEGEIAEVARAAVTALRAGAA